MATFTGISTLSDLNAQVLKGSAVTYGLDKINMEIQKSLAQYNAQVSEIMAEYAEAIDVQTKVFNLSSGITMDEVDEFGKARTKKDSGNWSVSFPVRKFIGGIGYSNEWLQMATVGEINAKFMSLQISHQKNLVKQMKKVLFTATNETFVDTHYNGETLTLRAFWNADGSNIPTNAAGTTFTGSSHSHYLGSSGSAVTATNMDSLVTLVTEHDLTSGLMIVIHPNDVTKISALTGFTSLSSSLLDYSGVTSTKAKLDLSDLNNRLVGFWRDSVPMWVKPYAIENYALCIATGDMKPLGYRQLPYANMQGLKLNNHYAGEPLVAEEAVSFEGFAVLNRSAGAVLQLNSANYTSPTIA